MACLLALLYFQVQGASLHEDAQRDRYDQKMREYVISHDLIPMREEAIEVRRRFRNAELKRVRTARASAAALAALLLYLPLRLWLRKSKSPAAP